MTNVPVARDRTSTDAEGIRSFRVDVSQTGIDDLRRRLEGARWPEKETVSDGTQDALDEVHEGNHFAAWQVPDLFSKELRAAFRPLRNAP